MSSALRLKPPREGMGALIEGEVLPLTPEAGAILSTRMRFAALRRRVPLARPSRLPQAETASIAGMARRARSAVVAVMALLALGLLLIACTRKRISDAAEAMDARAVHRYSEVLVRTGGASVAIRTLQYVRRHSQRALCPTWRDSGACQTLFGAGG